MITWPAIIKYSGDHELVYVLNQKNWNSNVELVEYRYDAEDLLIDSMGVTYNLADMGKIGEVYVKGKLTLDQITELVRYHAAELGNCCITKLIFPTTQEAVKAVASIRDEH